ncbi:Putative transcriptional regulator [Bacillus thuringiensis serovar israelensis ATCC 35646]|nr:Putative transcriptional regulator [Bacillus thuringiensis serovar israelensis ATCC 35646]
MKSASLLRRTNKLTKNIHDVAYELQKAIAEKRRLQNFKREPTQQFKPMAASKNLFDEFRTMAT